MRRGPSRILRLDERAMDVIEQGVRRAATWYLTHGCCS